MAPSANTATPWWKPAAAAEQNVCQGQHQDNSAAGDADQSLSVVHWTETLQTLLTLV